MGVSVAGKLYEPQPNQVVAKIAGQDLLGRDIAPPSAGESHKNRNPAENLRVRMEILDGYVHMLSEKIWSGLRDRIILENRLRTTSPEIAGYVKTSTRGKNLNPKEKLALESKAEREILNWKADYNLYMKYGGRIAKTGDRYFPAEAQLKYLKEVEAQGDFEIVQPELKTLFYEQYSPPRAVTIETGLANPFESPWWLNSK